MWDYLDVSAIFLQIVFTSEGIGMTWRARGQAGNLMDFHSHFEAKPDPAPRRVEGKWFHPRAQLPTYQHSGSKPKGP